MNKKERLILLLRYVLEKAKVKLTTNELRRTIETEMGW